MRGLVCAWCWTIAILLVTGMAIAGASPHDTQLPSTRPGVACPAHSGKGCEACVAATDGRCPGPYCDQPCVHTSLPCGKQSEDDCFPAKWWNNQHQSYPNVTCAGPATGCQQTCTPSPAPAPSPPPPHPPADIATAVYLTDYPRAKCLDGSPGYYYFRPAPANGVNATKWVLHIQGGGWCTSASNCAGRATRYLGSSSTNITHYPDHGPFTDILCPGKGLYCGGGDGMGSYVFMVNDPSVNEYSYDWNAVFLRYCDGMAFTANASHPIKVQGGQQIWLRGYEILHATFDSLIRSYKLGHATEVNLGGSSAGGHATYLHADSMADWVYAANEAAGKPHARVVAMPDSGFWPESQRSSAFREWFALQGNVTDGLPKNCKYRETNVTRCLFPEHFADEIETRLFPQQSLYDPDQHQHNKSTAFINLHGQWLLETMNKTILQTRRVDGLPNGAWIHSCTRHCSNQLLNIDGFTATTAFETLIGGGAQGPKQTLFLQNKPYPCKACCDDEPYPPQ